MAALDGRIALVTAAGKGIGEGIAKLLASAGASVAVAARTEADVRRVAASIGPAAMPVQLDVANRAEWTSAVAAVQARWGKLNILVNCAGVSQAASIEDADEGNWRRHIATNLDGTFYGCQAALPLMKASGEACSIVNIGSALGVRPMGDFAAYSTTKVAIVTLTRTIALHCAAKGYNIRANVVHPGGTETEMFEEALANTGLPRQEAYDFFAATHPMGRMGRVEEVARAVLFFASDASSFTTGGEICVDGGQTIRQ